MSAYVESAMRKRTRRPFWLTVVLATALGVVGAGVGVTIVTLAYATLG